MDINRIKQQLIVDEGASLEVYKDKFGNLTCGIGHLIMPTDHLFLGDKINQERCEALFECDIDNTICGCMANIEGFEAYPEEVQEVLVNMAYNLGAMGLTRFKRLFAALNNCDYQGAADEMVDSLWYKQVGNRAKRLEKRIRMLSQKEGEDV